MASAAAVASSSREALDMSKPVREVVMVWKLINDSRRPTGRGGIVKLKEPVYEDKGERLTLSNFRLIRRVLGIPCWVFEDLCMGSRRE